MTRKGRKQSRSRKLNKQEEKMYQAYCMKCKGKVEVFDPELVEVKGSRGTRKAVKGTCGKCGTKVFAILKKDGSQN